MHDGTRLSGWLRICLINIFDYRRAHTESTKDWLTILERENVPVLICLSFADKLFAELMGNNGDYDIEQVKHGVEKHLNVCTLHVFLNSIKKNDFICFFEKSNGCITVDTVNYL